MIDLDREYVYKYPEGLEDEVVAIFLYPDNPLDSRVMAHVRVSGVVIASPLYSDGTNELGGMLKLKPKKVGAWFKFYLCPYSSDHLKVGPDGSASKELALDTNHEYSDFVECKYIEVEIP